MTYITVTDSNGVYYYGGLVGEEELMHIDWVSQHSSYDECISYIKEQNRGK